MLGQMQKTPLLVNGILDYAALYHGEREIISRLVEGEIHRETYAQAHLRARKLSQSLLKLGLTQGDIIATLAWNTHRHLESWYAITGIGAVYHTLNPRLFAEQLVYIINHAADKFIITDLTFVPLLEAIADKLPIVKGFIIMTDEAHMPQTKLDPVYCFESLIEAENGDFDWVALDENAACGICYTSGTTGQPKGVVYSHRSNVIHTLVANGADVFALTSRATILPVVPMFHANSWGIAFAAPMVGAKMVLPGPKMDGESLYELLDKEKVTMSAAVPTIWLMLLQHLEAHKLSLPYLQRVLIGGAAVPRMMIEKFEKDYKVEVDHAWGMTETSPLGTVCTLKAGMENYNFEERMQIKLKQGRPPYLVWLKITDPDGKTLPRDGKTFGNLKIKGPFILETYLREENEIVLDEEGFFDTGDIATIDPEGYMQITDRAKDIVKSGGEWISSIEIENIAVGHADIAEAAIIGIAHPKWGERPLLIVLVREGVDIGKPEKVQKDILAYLEGKIAKWWMPNDIVFVDSMPHTAAGKIQKTALREQFKDYQWPPAILANNKGE
ncbi:MAG: long-chain-fatty-acid--CoA ligase [Alphaproteobacteria bacterium]|nr:long-chain-fatty-acid--CoA ligase [Alphaproteobacteria bacterium]